MEKQVGKFNNLRVMRLASRAVTYWHESLIEVKKIIWPTKKETVQATLGVLVMIVVMGLMLWTVDAILLRAVAWLLRP